MVPQRFVNGGDIKFEDDPLQVRLGGLMTGQEYQLTVAALNDELKKCRATAVDHVLLALGPTLVTLIPWALRHKQQRNARRVILARAVQQLNDSREFERLGLVMRWQTRPEKARCSCRLGAVRCLTPGWRMLSLQELTIWRKADYEAEVNR